MYPRINVQWQKDLFNFCCKYRKKADVVNLTKKGHAGLCKAHFVDDDFKVTPTGRRKIKVGRMPTQDLPLKSHPTREPSPRREIVKITLEENHKYKDLKAVKKAFLQLKKKDWFVMENFSYFGFHSFRQNHKITIEIKENLNITLKIDENLFDWSGPDFVGSTSVNDVLLYANNIKFCQSKISKKCTFILHQLSTQNHETGNLNMCEHCIKLQKKQANNSNKPMDTRPLKNKAPITKAKRSRVEATLQEVKQKHGECREELENVKAKLKEAQPVSISSELSGDLTSIISASVKANELTPYQKLFWEEQVKLNQRKSNGNRYHPEIIRLALSLYTKSPACYNELRLRGILTLPCKQTILDYRYAVKPEIGFSNQQIEKLKNCIQNLQEHEKYVFITFDEMQIQKGLVFDKANGEIVGFTDYGEAFQDEQKLASHVLGVYAKSIAGNFSQMLGYFPTETAKSFHLTSIFWDALSALETCGLRVMALCADGATNNRKMFSNLTKKMEIDHKFTNPFDPSRCVFLWPDPPHLIKTARNSMLKNLLVSQDGCIKWDDIVELYEDISKEQLHYPCKLSSQHVRLTAFSKMSVRYAAQVLSASVGGILKRRNKHATSTYTHLWNKFFDICNTSSGEKSKRNDDLLPFTSENDSRLKWISEDFVSYFSKWRNYLETTSLSATERKKKFIAQPTYIGLTILAKSIPELIIYLLNKTPTKFVCLGRLNQDCLERHFGQQRAIGRRNENPSVLQFGYNVQTISVQRSCNGVRGNVQYKKRKGPEVPNNEPVPKRKKNTKI